jgi:hypothetical protein
VQLDDAGWLAALFPGATDRGGLLVDDEHAGKLGAMRGKGKP